MCFSEIIKGKPHKCGLKSRVINLSNHISDGSLKANDQIMSRVIKEKVKEHSKGDQEPSVLRLSQIHGKPLQIAVGNNKKKPFHNKLIYIICGWYVENQKRFEFK